MASARVRTCITVEAGDKDTSALRRLVAAEVDRHASHASAEEDCESHLRIELVELDAGMGGGRYLTGRMDAEVPHRVTVGSAGMAPALESLLRVVLHNDPRRLRGPQRADWFSRHSRALRVQGRNYFGVELYQAGTLLGGEFQTLPGVALAVRRELSAFHIGVRIALAGLLDDPGPNLSWTTHSLAQIELAMYSSESAETALFGSFGLGLEYQRFRGPAPLRGGDVRGTATKAGLGFGLRGGVEFLRHASARPIVFAQLQLPGFVTQDADGGVIDQYVPSGLVGASLIF